MNKSTKDIPNKIACINQPNCNVNLISPVFNFLIKPTNFHEGAAPIRSISTCRIRKLKRGRETKMLGIIFLTICEYSVVCSTFDIQTDN